MRCLPSHLLILIALLFLLALAITAPGCREILPLTGEGPPPGYLSGDIPEEFRGLRNPFSPDDPMAIVAGEVIYSDNCLRCHGQNGRGTGPMAYRLEPLPADFAAPPMMNAFENHGDYVFWWVTAGVPQTAMPAFGHGLTEEQRWLVITYAWHLGKRAR